jgi:hypothetical protein
MAQEHRDEAATAKSRSQVELGDDELARVVGGSGDPGSGEPDKTGAH